MVRFEAERPAIGMRQAEVRRGESGVVLEGTAERVLRLGELGMPECLLALQVGAECRDRGRRERRETVADESIRARLSPMREPGDRAWPEPARRIRR